jgi:PucR-like helix-turn-helix protein/diguanylate cyclase with GGDEF domain
MAARLRKSRGEIEDAIMARIQAIDDPRESGDAIYVEGLRKAVPAAVEYALEALEEDQGVPPVPVELLAQARLAARNGVSLDTVLRRYLAGYTLLGDFVLQEAAHYAAGSEELAAVLRAHGATLDALLLAVSEEYATEPVPERPRSDRRRTEQVQRLLAGEPATAVDLGYNLHGHHLALIGLGPQCAEAIRELVSPLARPLLLVKPTAGEAWAWLGGGEFDHTVFDSELAVVPSHSVRVAVGEPAQGVTGWRLTHQQARSALPLALRGARATVRYGDVSLIAAVVRDETFLSSLVELYLRRLREDRSIGAVWRETLCAYFSAERNVSSAAAGLGLSRQTVINRLQAIEERVERPVNACAAELEAVLKLEEFGYLSDRADSSLTAGGASLTGG